MGLAETGRLRALWPRLSDITIMELKSPGRAFRPSELIRRSRDA
ncbi:MAG TPA: hypothetical protein VNM90_21345 [Haliangium sp.]|nr:hypothetical protein [Haliangium sp.]